MIHQDMFPRLSLFPNQSSSKQCMLDLPQSLFYALMLWVLTLVLGAAESDSTRGVSVDKRFLRIC